MNIAAADFKAKCLKMMDRVNETHEELVITKYRKPVVRVLPFKAKPDRGIFGYMAGTVQIAGDIVSPLDEIWDADKD